MFGDTKIAYSLKLEDVFVQEDIENRHLFLNDVVDEMMIDSIVYHILRYNILDKGIEAKDRKPIIIYINSPGGSVTDGFAIIDAITSSITPVYTVNLSICYSMGFLIFLAGNKRFSMSNATFLCHDGGTMIADSTNKAKDRLEFESQQIESHVKNYILSRTKIGEDLYEEKKRVEWYMYPDEAKIYNIVTDIVGIDCTIDEII